MSRIWPFSMFGTEVQFRISFLPTGKTRKWVLVDVAEACPSHIDTFRMSQVACRT